LLIGWFVAKAVFILLLGMSNILLFAREGMSIMFRLLQTQWIKNVQTLLPFKNCHFKTNLQLYQWAQLYSSLHWKKWWYILQSKMWFTTRTSRISCAFKARCLCQIWKCLSQYLCIHCRNCVSFSNVSVWNIQDIPELPASKDCDKKEYGHYGHDQQLQHQEHLKDTQAENNGEAP